LVGLLANSIARRLTTFAKGWDVGAFVQELFRIGLYKRSQGRIARQVTFAALAIIVLLAAWCLNDYYTGRLQVVPDETGAATPERGIIGRYVAPAIVLVFGVWASFRVVQMPSFADFLISVEAEMNKVSWPARGELFRASIVVILMIFFLAAILFAYDLVWQTLFTKLLS
jgi:preprotein translocase subunit SecE